MQSVLRVAFSVASRLFAAPEIYNSGTLQSSCTSYSVLNLIGEGCYGKVARCQNLQTKEEVAVKILKPDSMEDIKEEVNLCGQFFDSV